MARAAAVPIVRCRLDGPEQSSATLRYVPLAEFELWRHFMCTRHGRQVTVEAVSVWIPEQAALAAAGYRADELEAVLRLHLDLPGPHGVTLAVERFLPAETYPEARQALLSHYEGRGLRRAPIATPGYVIPARQRSARQTVA